MKLEIGRLIINKEKKLQDALCLLDQTGWGFLIVVDEYGKLYGVMTDGDVRRALLRGISLGECLEQVMRRECVFLSIDATAAEINEKLSERITFIPLVDKDDRPVDFASPLRHRRFPITEPLLDGNEMEYVQECIRTGWISSQGRFVGLFENLLADYHDAPYALSVNNGTVALHLALVSLGVGLGDEVIVPDFTFAATAAAVIHAGATPVFVDVHPRYWNMDVENITKVLTDRTKAIIPVHLYGHPCCMDPLMEIARNNDLLVVEDCAESLGSRYQGQLCGTFGDAACFSFFGNKTLTTGEGGLILFKDKKTFERARMLRDHGMSPQRRYWHLEAGYNYRMTNLQAAVGVAQVERIEWVLSKKRQMAEMYTSLFKGLSGVVLPPCEPWADPVTWLYTIRLHYDAGIQRDELANRLMLNGIETRHVFYPLHCMPPFLDYSPGGEFPVTESISGTGISLPSSVTLTKSDIEDVVAQIRSMMSIRRMAMSAGAWP